MTESNLDECLLEVRGLVKRFGDKKAVDGVSFGLHRGEFLTMLGPSGSGKTTTLRMVAGFERADSGSINLRGRDITEVAVHRRGIGMVFQNYALFPHMSAVHNVAFPLEMRGVAKREALRKAGSALEMMELSEYGGHLPKELSGGQQQRVALARAIVFEPDVLLMDEPLGALDKRLRETMQLEIARISRRISATVVYVTHDQEEALVMSDRIAIYNHGKIEQLGTAEDLYERPASLFVADFIGESNILSGRVSSDGVQVEGECWNAFSAAARRFAGEAVALVVRPEMMQIAARASVQFQASNSVSGRVTDMIYLGAVRKYIVTLPDGSQAEARIPRGAGSEVFEPGDDVTLTWDPSETVVVPDVNRYDPKEEEEER